jgi:hypothetical protein
MQRGRIARRELNRSWSAIALRAIDESGEVGIVKVGDRVPITGAVGSPVNPIAVK